MKKVMYLMLTMVTVLLAACSSSDDDGPQVSFAQSEYSLTSGSVAVRLNASGVDDGTSYPVTFGGTAVKDQDYTVDRDTYVIGGANAVTVINVTAKNNFTENKTITMTAGGATTTINLGVQAKRLYSFTQRTYILGEQVNVVLNLSNVNGEGTYAAPNDLQIALKPLASSTAVEGTNYEFVNKTATIKAGSNSCIFTIKRLNYEAGKDSIVLAPDVTEAEGYVGGQYNTTTVAMTSSLASDLIGTWQVKSITTDKNFWTGGLWYLSENDFGSGYPELNTNDTFTFANDGNGNPTLTTNLSSDFKNYFQPSSSFSLAGELTNLAFADQMSGGTPIYDNVQLLLLDNVNRYFSATQTSSDKEAYIGVRNEVEDGDTVLKVYIVDYEPKDFLTIFYDYSMFRSEKPTAISSYTFRGETINSGDAVIRFTLKKVK